MTFDGLLVIDKPAGITSRDAVNRALRWFPRGIRIGHAGTLDPLATGVLVLCVGKATRLIEYVQRMSKTYRAGITLGATSDTDDADGTITPTRHATAPTREQIDRALGSLVGEIEQTPPAYSAAKVTGRRAYDLARQGQTFDLKPRRVTVHGIDIVDYAYPNLDIEVRCSKGTYIRSLARDLGRLLGCGGFIASLRRLQIGCFDVTNALTLDAELDVARQRLLPIALAASDLPRITLDEPAARRLLHGQHIEAPTPASGEAAVFDQAGRLLAIAMVAGGTLHARKALVGADGEGNQK